MEKDMEHDIEAELFGDPKDDFHDHGPRFLIIALVAEGSPKRVQNDIGNHSGSYSSFGVWGLISLMPIVLDKRLESFSALNA